MEAAKEINWTETDDRMILRQWIDDEAFRAMFGWPLEAIAARRKFLKEQATLADGSSTIGG